MSAMNRAVAHRDSVGPLLAADLDARQQNVQLKGSDATGPTHINRGVAGNRKRELHVCFHRLTHRIAIATTVRTRPIMVRDDGLVVM